MAFAAGSSAVFASPDTPYSLLQGDATCTAKRQRHETLPGPWEGDLKRLATSFVVAGQHLGFRRLQQREAAEKSVRPTVRRNRM